LVLSYQLINQFAIKMLPQVLSSQSSQCYQYIGINQFKLTWKFLIVLLVDNSGDAKYSMFIHQYHFGKEVCSDEEAKVGEHMSRPVFVFS
jgi:hypothetical protein